MRIAENVGRFLKGFADRPRVPSLDLPAELTTARDQAAWAAKVQDACRASLPDVGDRDRGRTMRGRVTRILRGYATMPPVSLPYPRSTWRYLLSLAEMCARETHWDCATGPIVGCSNAVIEQRLGSNARRIFRTLARHGFIIPHAPKGNGHRYIREHADGSFSGAGWSLAPLIALIDALELVDAQERDLRRLHVELPRAITDATRKIFALIQPFAEDDYEWAHTIVAQLADIRSRRDAYRKGPPEALQATLDTAERLLIHTRTVTTTLANGDIFEKSSSRVDHFVHHQDTDPESLQLNVTSLPEQRSGGGERPNFNRRAEDSDEDRHGIKRSGFKWAEAPTLFPWLGIIKTLEGPNSRAWSYQLARSLHVSDAAVSQAQRQMGDDCAAIA